MFTIYIWDTDKYQPIEKINDLIGNENFLIPSDTKTYPLLGSLSFCEEDIFEKELLVELKNEVEKLMVKHQFDENITQYLANFVNLINKAISLDKSIFITPFVE